MSRSEIDNIRNILQNKDTNELLSVWEENNRDEWREEAFSAIHEILIARGVDIPVQKSSAENKQNSDEEDTKISFLGDEMCLGCGALVSKLLHMCPECGSPVSRATLDPIGSIMAQGHIYRKATKVGTSKIALIAMWLVFAPQIVLFFIQATYIIHSWIYPEWGLDNEISTAGILFLLFGTAVIAIYVMILYKATISYKNGFGESGEVTVNQKIQ